MSRDLNRTPPPLPKKAPGNRNRRIPGKLCAWCRVNPCTKDADTCTRTCGRRRLWWENASFRKRVTEGIQRDREKGMAPRRIALMKRLMSNPKLRGDMETLTPAQQKAVARIAYAAFKTGDHWGYQRALGHRDKGKILGSRALGAALH